MKLSNVSHLSTPAFTVASRQHLPRIYFRTGIFPFCVCSVTTFHADPAMLALVYFETSKVSARWPAARTLGYGTFAQPA